MIFLMFIRLVLGVLNMKYFKSQEIAHEHHNEERGSTLSSLARIWSI